MGARLSFVWLALFILDTAFAYAGTSISGSVKDTAGNNMNGVFVSATRDGAVFTTTVYSDKAGRFHFPELAEGMYTVTAHTGGFQPSKRSNVALTKSETVTLEFKLDPETRADELVKQSTASEWLRSLPGTAEQKLSLARNCDGCHHNVYQVRDYRFTETDWAKVISAMERIDAIGEEQRPGVTQRWVHGSREDIARYLGEVQGPDSLAPKIQFSPRPTGKVTHAVVTEYRLPRDNAVPHDVYLDAQGNAWYNDFKADYLGKLDPKTGAFKEYRLPSKTGTHPGSEEMFIDPEQNIWIGQRLERRYLRFDPRKEEVTGVYDDAKFVRVDTNRGVVLGLEAQLNLATGEIRRYHFNGLIDGYGNGYGIDSNGVGYKGGWTSDSVIRVLNPQTGEVTNYPTPTPEAAPRRVSLGSDGNIWFGEWRGGKIGKLDLKTKKITEYDMPDPFAAIYQADMSPVDHSVWSYDWLDDCEVRLDPNTGEVTQYPMPTLDVESRRTAFDPAAPTPTVWIHGAGTGQLIRIQLQ